MTDQTNISTEKTAQLRRVSELISAVSVHVREKYLSGFKEPRWTLAEAQVPGRLGKWLHRCYFTVDDWRYVWLFLILAILPCSFAIETAYASLCVLWISDTLSVLRAVMTFLIIPIAFLVLYNTVGAYWTMFEIAINRHLSWRPKVVIVCVVLLFNIFWFGLKPYLFPGISFNEPAIDQAVATLRLSAIYRTITAMLLYVPLMTGLALWVLKGWGLLLVKGLSAVRWLARFHRLESPGALQEFLLTPIPLQNSGESQALLELDAEAINALSAWAACRRDVIQSRLLPTTLVLAFLGLLANTKPADDLLTAIVNHFKVVFRHSGSLPPSWLGSYFVILAVVLVVYAVSKFLIELFNESFVTDYIVEACILAQHTRETNKKEVENQARQLWSFREWLKGLFR